MIFPYIVIVTFSFLHSIETKTLHKEYSKLPQEAPVADEVAQDQYELLGLVILEDEILTRRTSSAIGDDLELRALGKHKNKHHQGADNVSLDVNVLRREGDEESYSDTVLRAKCLTETDRDIIKCTKACNRAHEDVCEQLRCSSRSKRALVKQCDFHCKNIFNPKLC